MNRIYAKTDRYVFANQESPAKTLYSVYVGGEHCGYIKMIDGVWGFYPFTADPEMTSPTARDCINDVAEWALPGSGKKVSA